MIGNFLNIKPDEIIEMNFQDSIRLLKQQLGEELFNKAFQIETFIPSKKSNEQTSDWFKKTNIIEVNPRVLGTYWNIVKYALTFPEESINILSMFEAGCNGSIYSILNFKFNDEFLDKDLCNYGFDTAAKQIKLIINILHALDKNVGFDVLPHVDKYAETVFLYPEYFEWVKLNKTKTKQYFYPDVDYNKIYIEVQALIKKYLHSSGDSFGNKIDEKIINKFYDDELTEKEKDKILFGTPKDTRLKRRIQLINTLRDAGYETIPVTEHCPMRPVLFDKIVYDNENNWAEFKLEHKSQNAIIFNSLTPFKWYKIDKNGYPDTTQKEEKVWNYFINLISNIQKEFNFDFLRADMAHVQHSHSHNNLNKQIFNKEEMWAYLKDTISKNTPHFATLAEGFFGNYYINGFQDLTNKKFDIATGYLNMKNLDEEYIEYLKTFSNNKHSVKSCNCIINCDSDQEKNIWLYNDNKTNEIRVFTELFLNLSGYKSALFEIRNTNPDKNFGLVHNFISHRSHKYIMGKNYTFLEQVQSLRKHYKNLKDKLNNLSLEFLNTNDKLNCAWIYYDTQTKEPEYLFVFNLNKNKNTINIDDFSSFSSSKENSNYNFYFKEIFNSSGSKLETIEHDISINISEIEYLGYKAFKIEKEIKPKQKSNNNKNILLISTECVPYYKTGGLADANCDFTKSFKEKHPNYDIRMILPINCNQLTKDLTPTTINEEFEFTGNNYKIKLYETLNKKNNIITYFIESDAFSNFKEMKIKDYFAYCKAVVKILPKLKKLNNPFDVQNLHLTDWETAFVSSIIKNEYKDKEFYKQIRTLLVLHNIGANYQGRFSIFYYLLLSLNRQKLDLFINSFEAQIAIKKLISKLEKNYPINEKNFIKIILNKYEDIKEKFPTIFFELDKISIQKFPNIPIDDYAEYNSILDGLYSSTYWVTDSPTFYEEITNNETFAPFLFETLKSKKNYGEGILGGICPERYTPNNPQTIKYPFNKNNFKEGKEKNKEYIQKILSSQIEDKNFIKDSNNILGKLDIDKNATLITFASRPDFRQKGIDIFIDNCKKLLKEHSNIQILFVIPNSGNIIDISEILNLINISEYKGRIAYINEFVPIEKFFAGTDIFAMPSRYEPCGFSQLIAMRYGAIPVVSNTGGLKDTIISINENPESANGFKTYSSLYLSGVENEEFYTTLMHAIYVKENSPEIWNQLIKNAIKFDSSWNKEIIDSFKNIYDKLTYLPQFQDNYKNNPIEYYYQIWHELYLTNKMFQDDIQLNEEILLRNINYPIATQNLAYLYLLNKDFEKGLYYFENRFNLPLEEHEYEIPPDILPLWNKNINSKGKTVYIYYEGGYGDTIFYSRYIPLVCETGTKVILKVQDSLFEIFKSNIENENIKIISDKQTEEIDIDFQLPMMSLPYALNHNYNNIPQHIIFANKRENKFKKLMQKDKLNIGIVWQASLDNSIGFSKSIMLEQLIQLTNENCQLYSLQKEITSTDYEIAKRANITLCGEYLNDFSDTLELINALDIVISVDTACAHLSASINKPTWLLLNNMPDWRWFMNDTKTPWYNSMKLFRQTKQNTWGNVIQQIKEELIVEIKNKLK